MKAALRFGLLAFAVGLMPGPPALAQTVPQNTTQSTPPQSTPPPTSTTRPPASTTIGPSELQNFSLGGTPPPAANAPPSSASTQSRSTSVNPAAPLTPRPRSPSAQVPARRSAVVATPAAPQPTSSSAPPPPSSSDSRLLPTSPVATAPAPRVDMTPVPAPSSAAPLAPPKGSSMLPWLLAAVGVGALVGLFLWWRRPREAFVNEPPVYEYLRPEPEPEAQPRPTLRPVTASIRASAPRTPAPVPPLPSPPPQVTPARPVGIVTTRLRPWLDLALQPLGCLVDENQVVFEFEVGLQNSGNAPAGEIFVEASLFNAGPTQDQDIADFFARGRQQGDPLDPLRPLQQTGFRTSLVAARASLQTYDVGGRQVFVPVIALNAVYRWSSGEGQTSASYLIGRETGSDKLAPVGADAQRRQFAGLGARLLSTGSRR